MLLLGLRLCMIQNKACVLVEQNVMYYVVRGIVTEWLAFFFSSRRRHTRGALVTGVQTGALPICDAEGGIWVAHWNGWRITRFTPAGEVDRVIEMPVAQVTNCAFGGPDFDCLYITTAAINLDETALERQPLAGGLFAIVPGVKGQIGRAHV